MPLPEEVDEINEFLKNRREKQRMGELPKPDYTPGFVKKVKVAIFGKPAVPKAVLKSSQPSYVSTEAQVAMRKQLQEMVDNQTSKSKINTAPSLPAAAPMLSTSTPKPPAPRNFSNVPYPPYIQRGLASLPKTTPPSSIPTPRNAAPSLPKLNVPAAPAPALTTNRPAPFASAPRAGVSASAPLPASWPRSTSPASTTPLSPHPPSATLPSARAPATPLPTRAVNNTPVSTPAATTLPRKESFWKKIFGAKPAPLPAAAPPVTSTPPVSSRMDYAYAPIQGVHDQSTPDARATGAKADILPVNKPTTPNQTLTPTKTTLPVATTPSVPMVRPAPKIETRSPPSPSAAAASTVTPTPMATLSKSPPPGVSSGDGKTKPYLPPWAAPTTTGVSSSAYASSSLPWEEKKNSAPAAVSPLPRPRPVSSSQEIKVEESARPAPLPPSHASHDEAVREEISEEEALESLPFEEVEGLSQHDLDYLAKKEKEHREVEKAKDLDVGVPSQLKDTLQRQTSQLENVLQSTGTGTPDEKQEILRRLKKMMEDEGHSTG